MLSCPERKICKGVCKSLGLAGMLKQLDWVLAQDSATRQRYVELGLDEPEVRSLVILV